MLLEYVQVSPCLVPGDGGRVGVAVGGTDVGVAVGVGVGVHRDVGVAVGVHRDVGVGVAVLTGSPPAS